MDNRVSNLRAATHIENARNVAKHKDGTGPFRGVYRYKSKWRVRIYAHRKHVTVGHFDKLEEAIDARVRAEKRYFGDFARSNAEDQKQEVSYG